MSLPEFRDTHCTRYRYRYSECQRCADVCPHEAIKLTDRGLAVKDTACRQCALCTAACPTEALTTQDTSAIDLLRRALKLESVRVACAPSGQKGDEILPCLGALGAAALAFLASRGIRVVLAGASHCSACPHGPAGASALAQNLDGAGTLRAFIGNNGWAGVTLADDSDTPPGINGHDEGRRQLFRRILNPGSGAASPVGTQAVLLRAVRSARPVSSAGRELLQILFEQSAAAGQGKEAFRALPHHGALFAARIEMLTGCNACEVCARACPTGAIEVREHSAAWELTFRQPRCVGCGVCIEACQPRALRYADDMGEDPGGKTSRVLHALSKQRCRLCERFFTSAGPAGTCAVCECDDADFAALFG